MDFSTITEMKKAAADYANFCANDYSIPERALFWAQVSQALAAERQAAALERIATVLERVRGQKWVEDGGMIDCLFVSEPRV